MRGRENDLTIFSTGDILEMSMEAESLIRRQCELQGRIARAFENLKKINADKPTASMIKARLNALNSNSKFEAHHKALHSDHWNAVSEHEYVKSDYYGIVEENYITQQAAFIDLLNNLRATGEQTEADPSGATDGPPRKSLPRI